MGKMNAFNLHNLTFIRPTQLSKYRLNYNKRSKINDPDKPGKTIFGLDEMTILSCL